jgi:uncharacterized protein (TIGR02147 family)
MNIYQHLSYRTLIEEWFSHKKESNKRFSYQLASRILNSKSPSFIKDIIKGTKNLNDEQQENFIKTLSLTTEEEEYLRHLYILEHTSSAEIKHTTMERISAIRRMFSTFKIEGESYRYLSRWYCPAIRELSLQPDFRCDPQWIASKLVPKVTEEQAKEALQILQDLEMISFSSPTEFSTSEGSFSTPMQVQGLAVHNYHEQMLKLATESVTRFPEEKRHLLGVTVSVNKEIIPALKNELNTMVARILDLCEGDKNTKDHTIQVGLHFFPLCDD